MKLTGKGGTVSVGGVQVQNVKSFDYQESGAVLLGSDRQSTASVTFILESASDMIRQSDTIDAVLTVGNPSSITITMNDCYVDDASMAVVRDGAVTQSVSITCYEGASIA